MNIMMNTRQIFKHRYFHALAKSATEERMELLSRSGRVQNPTAELSASATDCCLFCICKTLFEVRSS